MGVSHDDTRLPCGRDVLALVRQVADGAPPGDADHQAGCVHCRRALARIRATMDDVRGLAAEPVAVPGDLVRRVMGRLRDERAHVAVAGSERGRTSVGQAIVARIAQRAALAVPGVAYASARMQEGGAAGSVRIEVDLVVAYGPAIEAVADAVRARIARDVERLAGLRVERVDVRIEDLS